MPADHDHLTRAEAACAELAATGQPITFTAVAVLARISRTTLYRRADLRAVIDDHRTRGQDASTLTSLTIQIDQLRRSLEAVAAKSAATRKPSAVSNAHAGPGSNRKTQPRVIHRLD